MIGVEVRAPAAPGVVLVMEVPGVDAQTFERWPLEHQTHTLAWLVEGAQRVAIRDEIDLTDAVWTGHGVGCACHLPWPRRREPSGRL